METVPFRDFDRHDNFLQFMKQVKSFDSQNFVIEFNANDARCAFNVEADGFRSLVAARKEEGKSHTHTRWINIWKAETQRESLQLLGKEYGFSPRLLLSMCSQPRRSSAPIGKPANQRRNYQSYLHWSANRGANKRPTPNNTPRISSSREPDGLSGLQNLADINHYKIVSEVWHFASVDWGHRFSCIGFNSVYQTPGQTPPPDTQVSSNKPAGKRVWSWLVLCDDNTVISIHENPFPEGRGYSDDELRSIRHNLLNVFKQLSTVVDPEDPPNPIMTVHIRPGLHQSHQQDRISEAESPSLLFYYLFDDWYTTYSLVARSEHQYGAHLERTRAEMFRVADIKNIDQLHHFGRQLAVLKRIYQSYIMLIERMLRGPQAPKRQLNIEETIERGGDVKILSTEREELKSTGYGVLLSTAAAVRFERLQDRINLYALNEIQDCLDEKEALVMLNFNLIALRESSYVERLTRITILLAKVTILFIPVSLMSAYFTVPFDGLEYTPAEYWIAFAVIFGLSVITLVVFGQLSGTQEGKPIYRSLTRVGFEAWKRFFGKKEVRDPEELDKIGDMT